MATSSVVKRWRVLYAGVLFTFTFGIIAIIFRFDESNPPLDEIFPAGEIRIGVDASYPPFAFSTSEGLTGFEIDLGRALGTEIGLPVRFVNIGFDGLYDALTNEPAVVDILISQLLIDPMRKRDVAYTDPYFNVGLVLVSDADSDIDTMRTISGHALAYEFGSEADNEARIWSRRIPAFETRPYELPEYALDAVRLNEADAALTDAVTARLYIREYPDWDATMHYVTDSHFAIAVSVHDVERARLVNRVLQKLIDSGVVDAIIEDWL